MTPREPTALTDEQYWSGIWQSSGREAAPIDPASEEYRDFHQFFSAALKGRRGRLLEVGCGGSRWLPYFASAFGFEVHGIDYSPVGCRQASEILARAGIAGTVLERDAFASNPDLTGQFDAVVSLGLVEHFADTAQALGSLARYVRPGGVLISTAPNMAGLVGRAQRLLQREVFDGHVAFTLDELIRAHQQAGLDVQSATYFSVLDFHILNLHDAKERWKWLVYRVLTRCSRIAWKLPVTWPRTRLWSAELGVAAEKKAGNSGAEVGDGHLH